MKKIIVRYFSGDRKCAFIALIILLCVVTLTIGHIFVKAGTLSYFFDALFCVLAWELVCAVYRENINGKK